MRCLRSALVAVLVVSSAVLAGSTQAAAFGTIDGGGQHREHERLSRAALACADGTPSEGECFEARSIDLLAGHGREFGAVGAPDRDETSVPAAHCDGADFLQGAYPRSREEADTALIDCVDHVRARFQEAVREADGLVDGNGQILPEEVGLESDCRYFDGPENQEPENRAKCAVLEAFGRTLHGVQDFYSHSNWADQSDPAGPTGPANPPGLNRRGPSELFDLRSTSAPRIPEDLTTGCFVLRDEVVGVAECTDRVTHAALNKDTGLIDPVTGAASEPTTPRGLVEDNFARAVQGGIDETRRQWHDLRSELAARYGIDRAALMTCALTRDAPTVDCRDHGELVGQLRRNADKSEEDRTGLIVGVVVAALVVVVIGAVVVRRRRRRRSTDEGV